jgi:hypothetical protein
MSSDLKAAIAGVFAEGAPELADAVRDLRRRGASKTDVVRLVKRNTHGKDFMQAGLLTLVDELWRYEKATELTERQPTMAEVRRGLRAGAFECLDLHKAEMMHVVACGEGWALVIGHRGNASYEWVYVQCSGTSFVGPPGYVPRRQDDEVWEHSNCGFGGVASALLEALLHAEGGMCSHCGCCVLPEDSKLYCRRCIRERRSV